MIPEIYDAYVKRPWPSTMSMSPHVAKARRPAMRQVLERFLLGKSLNLNYDIKELGSGSINAAMQGFFEFRSGPPVEQTRLLGHFALPGAFVATLFKARGELEADDDEPGNTRWRQAMVDSQDRWANLFPDEPFMTDPWPVLTQDHLAEYLNGDADHA
jgi:hypothetical protein